MTEILTNFDQQFNKFWPKY